MRKGFNGLHAMVTERLGEDPRQERCSCSTTGGIRGLKSCAGTVRDCGCFLFCRFTRIQSATVFTLAGKGLGIG
jgi:hypothetical protein